MDRSDGFVSNIRSQDFMQVSIDTLKKRDAGGTSVSRVSETSYL